LSASGQQHLELASQFLQLLLQEATAAAWDARAHAPD
jgi:hypothetical protein